MTQQIAPISPCNVSTVTAMVGDGHVNAIIYNDLRLKDSERDLRVAVSSTHGVTVEVPEHPPWPTSKLPDICKGIGQTWYYSRAPMEGIQSVEICKDSAAQVCLA
jgi:hypothetical protein